MKIAWLQEIPRLLTIFQLIIGIEFGLALVILIFTIIGISFNYQVSSYLILSAFQTLITIPGLLYIKNKTSSTFLALYIALQIISAAAEFFWFFFMALNGDTTARIMLVFLLLLVQLAAIISAIFFRNEIVRIRPETSKTSPLKAIKPKIQLKNASKSMSSDTRKSGKKTATATTTTSETEKALSPGRSLSSLSDIKFTRKKRVLSPEAVESV